MTHLLGWYKEARVTFHMYEQNQANWHMPANGDIYFLPDKWGTMVK